LRKFEGKRIVLLDKPSSTAVVIDSEADEAEIVAAVQREKKFAVSSVTEKTNSINPHAPTLLLLYGGKRLTPSVTLSETIQKLLGVGRG
jgi:ABC-type uncharacterized transport system ATPase subunit